MKITAKSILRADQLRARTELNPDGVEVYLTYPDLKRPESKAILETFSPLFKIFHLETGDRTEGKTPTDLTEEGVRDYIRDTLQIMRELPNHGTLTVHLSAGCDVLAPPYRGVPARQFSKKHYHNSLARALDFISEVDPCNELITLENTFPTDWMDEEMGDISFYPIGKLTHDFGDRLRTFDVAHCGITLYTLMNAVPSRRNMATFNHPTFGPIPFYFGEREEGLAQYARKNGMTEAVCSEVNDIPKGRLKKVHFNNSQRLLDGFGISEGGDIDLKRVLAVISSVAPEAEIVTEVKERQTRNYLDAPNQREMRDFLRAEPGFSYTLPI